MRPPVSTFHLVAPLDTRIGYIPVAQPRKLLLVGRCPCACQDNCCMLPICAFGASSGGISSGSSTAMHTDAPCLLCCTIAYGQTIPSADFRCQGLVDRGPEHGMTCADSCTVDTNDEQPSHTTA